jgi:hypothetical protein
VIAWCIIFLLGLAPSLAGAQSLEPRLYLPLPTGLNFVSVSYSYARGDVIVESAVPVFGFSATTNGATLAYIRTFGLLGRAAQVQAVAPFIDGTARGVVATQDSSRDLSGPADPMLRLAVNLAGGPAYQRGEMPGGRLGTVVGASLSLCPPLGHYEHDRQLNVGANRWSLKPELGVVQPWGQTKRWAIEAYAGVWLFSDNSAFLDTSTVSQEPLWALQGHLIRVLGRRGWIALDGTLVRGGTTSVDGVEQNTFQRNVRLGATATWSLGGGHVLKASFSRGVYTRFGGDFDVLAVGYLYGWGGASSHSGQ